MKKAPLWIALAFALPFGACTVSDGDDDGAGTGDDTVGDDVADDAPGSSDDVADDAPGSSDDAADDAPETGVDDGADTGTGEMACVHTCAADGDCTQGGMDVGYVCQDTMCVPSDPVPPCADDAECIAMLSGWAFTPCTMGGGECTAAGQVCVDVGDGTGGCAYPAEGGALSCDMLMMGEVDATNLDDGAAVSVCGNANAYCDADTTFCSVRCVDDTLCGDLTCNVASGVCECDADADCTILDGGTCVDTVCHYPGCADDSECTNVFDGGTVSCQ